MSNTVPEITLRDEFLSMTDRTEYFEYHYIPKGGSEARLVLETDDPSIWSDVEIPENDALIMIQPGVYRPVDAYRTAESLRIIMAEEEPCPEDCSCVFCKVLHKVRALRAKRGIVDC